MLAKPRYKRPYRVANTAVADNGVVAMWASYHHVVITLAHAATGFTFWEFDSEAYRIGEHSQLFHYFTSSAPSIFLASLPIAVSMARNLGVRYFNDLAKLVMSLNAMKMPPVR